MVSQEKIDALRNADVPPQGLLVDGTWQEGSGETLEVCSPIDGAAFTTLERAGAEDVNRAVAAARRAFDDGRWN